MSWINPCGWPDDDTLESKHVAVCIILCNKLLCLTETYIFCVSDKHVGVNTVKNREYLRDKMWTVLVRLSIFLYLHYSEYCTSCQATSVHRLLPKYQLTVN